jgi:hypothetical protein
MWPGERGPVWMWAGPALLAGVALGFDALNRRVPFGLLSTGPLDEVAHLASAALGLMVLACLVDVPRRFYVAALVASVAIDLDHIPLYLGLLPAPGHTVPDHGGGRRRCRGGQSPAPGRAGRGSDRARASFRAGHSRGPARCAAALATSGEGMDRQRLVVPGNDHCFHRRPADLGDHRYPAYACPPLPGRSQCFGQDVIALGQDVIWASKHAGEEPPGAAAIATAPSPWPWILEPRLTCRTQPSTTVRRTAAKAPGSPRKPS